MAYSLRLQESVADPLGFTIFETVVDKGAWDLQGETDLTVLAHLKCTLPSGESFLFGSRATLEWPDGFTSGGGAAWQVTLVSDGSIKILVGLDHLYETATGVWSSGVPFTLAIRFDLGASAANRVEVDIDGSAVSVPTYASPGITAFPEVAGDHFVVGYRNTAGTSVVDTYVDYVKIWEGVSASDVEILAVATTGSSSTLGAPHHFLDFESNLTDTGTTPFAGAFSYAQNVTYSTTEAIQLFPTGCSSLTFAQSIEAEDAGWVVYATIEGCGTADGLYRFCTTVPHFAEGDALFRPWLAEWPDILSEGAPRDDGGIVDAGELSLSILDLDDALTSEWRTEGDPETYIVADLVPGDTSFTVLDNSGFTAGDVIYIASEAMIVDEVGGSNTLIVTRGALDTQAVNIPAGMLVYRHLPYLLSRRIRVYVVSADACEESEAQAIGEYRVDQKELDDTLGVYTVRGPSQIIFANAQVSRRQPERWKVKASYPSGKIAVEPRVLDQALADTPYWFADDPRCFLRFGEEVATAANISLAGSQYPIFELRDRGVMGTPVENSEEAKYIEVAYGADPEASATGAHPTFFRYAAGPTPASVRDETWIPSCNWVDLILNLLVSSAMPEDGLELLNRVSAYGAWDCLPPGIGIGQRAATIDWAAALSVRARTPDYLFPNFVVPNEPVTFGQLITEEFLRPVGAYITTSGGLLRIVMPRIPLVGDTSFTVGHADIVSERVGEKLHSMGVRVKQDMSEIVTSLEYELGSGRERAIVTINDADYDLTYGSKGYREHETRRRKVKVPSVRPDTDGSVEFLKYRGMSVMARKRYPATTLEYVTWGLKYWNSTAGDVGAITHGQVPDQHLGVRGVVDLQGEIRQRRVTISPDAVAISHTLRTDRANSRMGLIAPAARVVSVATDGGNRAITVSANRFTEADADEAGLPATDAAAFTVGDEVELRHRDGAQVSATTQTITAVAGNVITVDGTFGASLDTGTTDAGLIIAYAEHSSSSGDQTDAFVYVADPVTRSVDGSDDRPWRYAEP